MYDTTKPYLSKVQQAIQSTWHTPYAEAMQLLGNSYPYVHVKTDKMQVDHTDGIGTKGIFHWTWRTFAAAVQDALAMNLNDLLTMRLRPIKLQNHLTIQRDDHPAVVEIITSLCEECRRRVILVSGGETSVQNNMEGMDLSLTITGICEVPISDNEFLEGDLLVGLPSSGLHSNGFTFVREFMANEQIEQPLGVWMKNELTTPTRIYWDQLYPVVTGRHYEAIHGIVHIAGGGFTRLVKHVDRGLGIKLGKWPVQPIFEKLNRLFASENMYATFNCGIGMILSVSPKRAEEVATLLGGSVIGEVTNGLGGRVSIDSIFDDKTITFG